MKSLVIDKDIISLKNLVTGYKITDTSYFDINYISIKLSLLLFKGFFLRKEDKTHLHLKTFSKYILEIIIR